MQLYWPTKRILNTNTDFILYAFSALQKKGENRQRNVRVIAEINGFFVCIFDEICEAEWPPNTSCLLYHAKETVICVVANDKEWECVFLSSLVFFFHLPKPFSRQWETFFSLQCHRPHLLPRFVRLLRWIISLGRLQDRPTELNSRGHGRNRQLASHVGNWPFRMAAMFHDHCGCFKLRLFSYFFDEFPCLSLVGFFEISLQNYFAPNIC